MTASQTYQTDDDQLVQAPHDHAITEPSMIQPEAILAAAEPDLAESDAEVAMAEPDADLAQSDADVAIAEPDLTEPDAGEMTHEDLTPDPAAAAVPADSQAAAAMVPGYPGLIPGGEDSADEPEMADGRPGSPSPVSAAFTVPEAVPDSRPAGDTVSPAGPWNEVQAMFVDDPHASIERAAGLVDDRVEELIQVVRQRQRSVQSACQADDAGTEELRIALQRYRSFWNSLEDSLANA